MRDSEVRRAGWAPWECAEAGAGGRAGGAAGWADGEGSGRICGL